MKKNYIKETYKNRADWLKSRGIGGSSASAILGMNPWTNRLNLYCSVISEDGKADKEDDTEAKRYGTECERHIREIAKMNLAQCGMRVRGPSSYEMYRRKDKPWMTATLDGVITDLRNGEKGILEIKTHDVSGKADLAKWEGKIPDNYFVQVLHYLAVVNDAKFAIIAAKLRFFDYSRRERNLYREEIRYYEIRRDDPSIASQISYLEKKETEFWEENIEKRAMPKMTIAEGR